MRRAFFRFVLPVGLAAAALGQTPVFDAADVHVSAKSPNAYMTNFFRSGRYEIRKATMLDLIRIAYGVDSYRISGGPGWLELDRFDVIAKAPPGAPPETLNAMLKNLLAERFKLAVHNDTKAIPTFFLTQKAKKNMTPGGIASGPAGCDYVGTPPPEPGGILTDGLDCHNATMQQFIDALRYPAAPYLGVGPLLDKTSIEGGWDFKIRWTRRAFLQQAGSDGTTIFDAVDKQLGLKLESQNAATPIVVVDKVNEKPTENAPDVARLLPPPVAMPTEFEVADVKPSRPGSQENVRITPWRVELRGSTLQDLITLAWDKDPDMLVGAPKWLNTDRFDVVAKAPVEVTKNGNEDFETIQVMLRALLMERFKLAVHEDTQPVNVYVLTAPKRETRMKKADESNRASCKYSPELLSPKTPLTNIWSCQNTSMGELADKLRGWAPAYFDRQVVDATGIEERFDFILGWTGKRRLMPNAATPAGPDGTVAVAADPTGGVSVFEAVERQLGLKLEAQKHAMPVLVIDHVERKPAEN